MMRTEGSSSMTTFLFGISLLINAFHFCLADRGKLFYNEDERQKSYEEEEKGKVAPVRTFLYTWEIALICIFSIVGLFLLIGLLLYLCRYGCKCPDCCQSESDKALSRQELQRERKIGEIWQTRYQPVKT